MRDSPVVCGGGVAMQQSSYETDLRDRTNSLAGDVSQCHPAVSLISVRPNYHYFCHENFTLTSLEN